MKLNSLATVATLITASTVAFAQTAVLNMGDPTVTKNGNQITLQFPVSVTIDGTTINTNVGTGTSTGTTGTTGSTGSAGSAGSSNSTGSTDSSASTGSTQTTVSTGTTGSAVSPLSVVTGTNGAFNGFKPIAVADLYTDISNEAVDPFTTEFMNVYGPAKIRADFSIPYNVVNSATKNVISSVDASDESDVMPVPINASTVVEGGFEGCTADGADHHALIFDSATGFDYELYNAGFCNGKYSAYSVTLWDLTKDQKRPVGWTSSDAAGLPVLPLLVRYDEVAAGSIDHALRVTMNHTKTGPKGSIFVGPATHGAGDVWGTAAYMGMRLRLKKDFDVSGFSTQNKVILTAMKKYGMIVADNGQSGFFQGTDDARWNQDDLQKLRTIPLSAFDIVAMGPQTTADTAPKGKTPKISSFSASQAGSSTVLMWNVTDDSYDYIAEVGPVRGSSVTVPYVSGATYTLVSTNQFGRTTKTVKVK